MCRDGTATSLHAKISSGDTILFVTPGCRYCESLVLELNRAGRKRTGLGRLTVIGDGDPAAVFGYLDQLKLWSPSAYALKSSDDLYRLGVSGFPHFLEVGPNLAVVRSSDSMGGVDSLVGIGRLEGAIPGLSRHVLSEIASRHFATSLTSAPISLKSFGLVGVVASGENGESKLVLLSACSEQGDGVDVAALVNSAGEIVDVKSLSHSINALVNVEAMDELLTPLRGVKVQDSASHLNRAASGTQSRVRTARILALAFGRLARGE